MSAEESIVCCDVVDVLTVQYIYKDGCRNSWNMKKQNISWSATKEKHHKSQ
jgi:hypothetical protein